MMVSLRRGLTGWRPGTLVLLVALLASALLAVWATFALTPGHPYFANDAHAYWVVDVETMYVHGPAPAKDAFLYTPPIGLVISTFSMLPLDAFLDVWRGLQVVLLIGMTGPLAGPLALVPLVGTELAVGNISLIVAAVVVVGFRYPAAWSLVLLTKVTPGVGLVWFLVRREWRPLATALGISAAVVLVTLPLVPGLWADWLDLMVQSVRTPPADTAAAVPFVLRLALGLVVVVIGAASDRPWTVPIAVMLGHAHLWSSVGAVLVACVPLAFYPALARPRARRTN